jgi:hypothetical protein
MSRNITIAVIGIFVILAAIGSAANRDTTVAGATAPPDVNPSQDAAEASEPVSPTPGGTSLLSINGTGPLTSDPFSASGTSVNVAYTYTCSTEDTFSLNFYGAGVSPVLPDVLAGEFGTSR